MASSVLNFLLVGTDAGASRAIARLGTAAEATSAAIAKASNKQQAALTQVSRGLNVVGKASAALAVGIGIAGVKAAVGFESALTRVSTQAGAAQKDLKGLGDAIIKLSPKVGFNPEDLATSLYHVESAFHSTGITAQKAIDVVGAAAKLAKIGHADLEDTTQAIIGVLASNIKGIKDPLDAAAQLNQLVGSGDTNLQTVAKSIATGILPTAATLGLTFKDVAAAIATLTDNVTPADQAARVLKTSLLTLIKPSSQQVTAFQELGLGALQLGQDFRKPNGLLVGVTDLKNHLDAVFPAGQKTALTIDQLDGAQKSYYQTLVNSGTNVKDATKQSQAFRDSITGISSATLRANAVARALGGSKTAGTFLTFIQEIDRLTSKYKESGTSLQAAAKFQAAWAQQQGTAKQKLDDLKASWDVFLVKIGNTILPDLKRVVDVLAQHPQAIQNVVKAIALFAGAWATVKVASIIASLGRLATAFFGVATAAGTAATAEAGAATAGAGAAAGGAAGAARYAIPTAGGSGLALGAAGKVLLPIAVAIVAVKSSQEAIKALKDLGEHQYGKALVDGLNNILLKGLTFGISGGIAKAIQSGDWVKALGPGAGLIQKVLGGALPGGGLSGKVGKGFTDSVTEQLQGQLKGVNDKIFDLFTKGQSGTALYKQLQFESLAITNQLAATSEKNAQTSVNDYLAALAKSKSEFNKLFPDLAKPPSLAKTFPGVPGANAPGKGATGATPSTQVADYLKALQGQQALFNKLFPTAAADAAIKKQDELRTALGNLKGALSGAGNAFSIVNHGLDLHTAKTDADKQAILTNQVVLSDLGAKAVVSAKAFAAVTGKQQDFTNSLKLAIPQILDQAQATGISRQAAADYLNKIVQIPGFHVTTLGLVKDAAEKAVQDFLAWLNQIPRTKYVDFIVSTQGSAPAGVIASATQGGSHGLGAGRFASGGVAKGWAWVGEHGKELIHVGSPSRVLPHGESMAVAGARPGGDTYVTVNLSALDTKTAEQALRGGLAKTIATEIKRAQRQGFTLN